MLRSYVAAVCLFCWSISVLAKQGVVPTGPLTLPVVVTDKSGTPVAGLAQQDFTILDNKQPQTILSFQAVNQAASATDSEVVLVIDSVNTGFAKIAYAREQVMKFLRQDAGRLVRPFSIDFLTDSGLDIQPTASCDGNALAAYVDQHGSPLRSLRRSQGFYGAEERAQLSLHALAELAEYEAKRPSRKIVIWISPGWPLLSGPRVQLTKNNEQSIFNTIVAVSTQIRQAHMTLYSVDPLGTADAGGFRTFYYEAFFKPVTAPKQAQFGNLALQVFAHQSGGRVLNGSNDIAGGIESCIRDANAYYVLSFTARAADEPNEFHAIEVKVAKPDVKAQTLSGYYAQPVRPRAP